MKSMIFPSLAHIRPRRRVDTFGDGRRYTSSSYFIFFRFSDSLSVFLYLTVQESISLSHFASFIFFTSLKFFFWLYSSHLLLLFVIFIWEIVFVGFRVKCTLENAESAGW